MKLTIIGAGSTYSPELAGGLAQNKADLPVDELALMDIDPERLGVVGGFIKRQLAAGGCRTRVVLEPDLTRAVSGADFVVTQIRVGGNRARHEDIRLGLEHGVIGQETVGVGGWAKAMRTIPAILKICRAIEEAAPNAWLINFTNPSGIVTEAILKHSRVRTIGLCNVPIGLQMEFARVLGVAPKDVYLDYIGLNHLGWVRRVYNRGKDVTSEILANLGQSRKPGEENGYDPEFLSALGMIPSYYLRYYYKPREVYQELAAQPRSRAEEVMEIEADLLDYYRNPANTEKPELLKKRGGAFYSYIAVQLMLSIVQNRGDVHIVNVRNGGAIPDLPVEAVVEIPALIDARGAQPLQAGELPLSVRGLVQVVKAYEQLTIEAAVKNSYGLAWQALATNPLVGSVTKARELLDRAIVINHFKLK